MKLKFDFATADHVHFGRGSISNLAGYLDLQKGPALVVTGRFNAEINPVISLLRDRNIEYIQSIIQDEPESEFLDVEASRARTAEVQLVISIGGGSVLDAGKALAMLISNGGKIIEYAEVVGSGRKVEKLPVPMIAIPTTAGTGSEVTKNAVVIFREKKTKASVRHPSMIPHAAIIDSDLMLSVPQDVTAYTGMDALTQVLEAYLSIRSNPLIDPMCVKALPLALEALPVVYEDGTNTDAREKMAYVSLIGGMALANAGLGAVHGFAAAIGGMYDVPHGLICACFLPVVFEANYLALVKKNPKDPILAKFQWFAGLCGNKSGEVTDAIETLYDLRFQLNIPGMRKFGMDRSMMGEIAHAAANTSSMKGNPLDLSHEQLMEIYTKCV